MAKKNLIYSDQQSMFGAKEIIGFGSDEFSYNIFLNELFNSRRPNSGLKPFRHKRIRDGDN